jgi:DMSO/TMAO reductase YedYZ molybdopterin-dependent catalytic subunit
MSKPLMTRAARARRGFLRGGVAAAGTTVLAGCDALSRNETAVSVLRSANTLTRTAQKALVPRAAMAQEFPPELAPAVFRANGTLEPADADWRALAAGGFAGYALAVGGLVAAPRAYTLAELRALPARTQVTRHDCVEGWSCIGRWTGVPLGAILAAARPAANARYVVFRCFDSMEGVGTGADDSRYYESIDLDEARHPQTILAYDLNGAPLPVANGAPLRLRVERQLGYKHAKYLRAIELVESFAAIRGGRGGYWEDEGYEWWAGI